MAEPMLDCSAFLEDYSSFRDGLLPEGRQEVFEQHLAGCARCARYDRVLGSGVEVFRGLETVEPSCDFMVRLQHRIYHVEEEMRSSRQRSSGASVGFTLAIAAVIGVSAWAPVLRPEAGVVELPPMAANAPVPPQEVALPPVFRSGPVPRAPEIDVSFAGAEIPASPVPPSLLFRYSPLGVNVGGTAPAVQAVQTTPVVQAAQAH
jgi:anti-sigma factor RsiW